MLADPQPVIPAFVGIHCLSFGVPSMPRNLYNSGRCLRILTRPLMESQDCPPLQLITCPVMNDASSDARNAIVAACSSGSPDRLMAC